jgi:hypothetical protein
MKMFAIVAQTFIADGPYPAITHRFLGPSFKEARALYRMHRKADAMLRACTSTKMTGGERSGIFEGIPCRTVFRVQKSE